MPTDPTIPCMTVSLVVMAIGAYPMWSTHLLRRATPPRIYDCNEKTDNDVDFESKNTCSHCRQKRYWCICDHTVLTYL